MAIDTPATIVIIGAGPIGLEAALYARYLGYEVLLLERETVAAEVRRWGHLPMVTPFGTCVSKLGLAALHAQDPAWRPPLLSGVVTGNTWCDSYLLPLAHSDLIADSLRQHTQVVTIRPATATIDGASVADAGNTEETDNSSKEAGFRVLVRDTKTAASYEMPADVVIDTSGVSGRWGYLSGTDTPLAGEIAAAGVIQPGLPDLRGNLRAKYAGRKTLLVGEGLCALAALSALIELIDVEPDTEVVWISPPPASAAEEDDSSPVSTPGNRTPDESKLAAAIADRAPRLRYWPGASIASLAISGEGTVDVRFDAAPQTELSFDQIVNVLGFQASEPEFWGLPIKACPTWETSRSSRQGGSADFAARHVESIYAQIAQELITSEPHFYVLGSKRFAGRKAWFTVSEGLDQVCALFTILGDRPNLNLYATMDKLLP